MSDTDPKKDDETAKVADLETKIEKLEADVEKWKGLSRKHEDRAKENAEAATELQKLKDGDKSDSQKAADKAAAAEKRADDAEAKTLRLEVAIDKAPEGMSIAQVRKLSKRLTGSTQAELEEDAVELFADFKPDTGDEDDDEKDKDTTQTGRPKERLKSGSVSSTDTDDESDPDKLAAKVPRMY